ncbi:hypothetical protein SS50377_27227 [Spironucleus salmonicida]|uniref:Uncharacterized protein n=1 Tax=Spironucleus salmonicida TaxID=348837 RepID=V6M6A9_9EUKA|nr:hypothetical protein SS50377_27227 [Spironucleus salmonicida]|eukprot:EST48934.1 Hypothetical protein SS50377_10777 [Spironucleus salmonicida]
MEFRDDASSAQDRPLGGAQQHGWLLSERAMKRRQGSNGPLHRGTLNGGNRTMHSGRLGRLGGTGLSTEGAVCVARVSSLVGSNNTPNTGREAWSSGSHCHPRERWAAVSTPLLGVELQGKQQVHTHLPDTLQSGHQRASWSISSCAPHVGMPYWRRQILKLHSVDQMLSSIPADAVPYCVPSDKISQPLSCFYAKLPRVQDSRRKSNQPGRGPQ